MAEKVFVAAATVKCPGAQDICGLGALATGDAIAPLNSVSFGSDEILIGDEVGIDRHSPFYPVRSSEKLMRREVIAAAIGVSELLSRLDLGNATRGEMPLFVATGMSMEGHPGDLDWLSTAFRALTDSPGDRQRNKRLMQLTPPLLAVKTLTNSTASFIAERTQIAGNNTTFGSTSVSGHYALAEAFSAIATGGCEMCLVGGASQAGVASHATYRNFPGTTSGWCESTAAVFLLLESEKSSKARGATPVCELTILRTAGRPRVTGTTQTEAFLRFTPYGEAGSLAVYSGAFCEDEFLELTTAVSKSWSRRASLFPFIGNAGAANIFLNLLTGVAILDGPGLIDCLDRDPYSRESFVRATVTS